MIDAKGEIPDPPVLARALRFFGRSTPFLYLGVRYRIIHLLLKFFRIRHFDFVVDFFGLKYRGNIVNHIDFHTYFFGAYEKGLLRKIRELVPDGAVAWDVGANSGHHSLFFATFCRHVYSFEPYPKIIDVLEARVEENNLRNVTVMPIGLGSVESKLAYYEPPTSNLGIGSFLPEHSVENKNQGLNLNIRTGDQVSIALLSEAMKLIKVDVEGFELPVLKGLRATLKRCRPVVVFEYCARHAEIGELLEQFPPGYSFMRVKNEFADPIELVMLEPNLTSSAFIFALPAAQA